MEALTALARAAYQARTGAQPLPPDAAEALAQLARMPAPLDALGTFLQAAADPATALPPSPPALPDSLHQLATALLEALRQA